MLRLQQPDTGGRVGEGEDKKSGVLYQGDPAFFVAALVLVEKESHLYSSHLNILAAPGKTHDVLEYLLRGLNKRTCFVLHKRLYMLNNQLFSPIITSLLKKNCAVVKI